MKKLLLVLAILFLTAPAIAQKNLSDLKPYEELTKEELFQMGEIAAINSYNDGTANIILGIFAGSFAIDAVASKNSINSSQYKRWTKRLDLDEEIISDDWFAKGFITKRKTKIIESIRAGRLGVRIAAAAATVYFLSEADVIDLNF